MSTTQTMPAGALNPLLDKIKSLPKVALVVGGALLVAVIIALALWNRAPEYKVLFTNLSERDGGAIMGALNQMNVPYQFSDGSAALMVPADKVHETRLALASQGLPRGGSVGFELLDDSKFGVSQFTEQVNFQRALEGELARSIEAVQSVQSARVHLALPRQSVFVRNRQAPSASVLLNLFSGRTLDEAQVAAIAHLVSSSVPDLTVANISIVDQYGRLLSLPQGEGRGMDAGQTRQVRDIEQSYAQRIETLLTPLLGPGNARAQVSAELDFSRREETSEVYRPNEDPNQAAIRSRQTSESLQRGPGVAQGVPGALTNQPPVDPVAPVVNPPAAPNAAGTAQGTGQDAAGTAVALPGNERRDATTNYELDRTITHLQHAVGSVSRLSVAVIVNHLPDADGNPQPLPAEQLEQLRNLVREAIGFSAERGDSLSLMNSAFASPVEVELPWWQNPMYVDLAKTAGGWLLFLLIAVWLWLGVGRPLLRRHVAGDSIGATSPAAAQGEATPEVEADESAAAAARARQQSRYEENLQTARELAAKDPRAVAAVLRTWIEKDEQ